MRDVDIGLAVRDGLHRRLQPLDVARVIGAQHVDHVLEAAQVLVAVVGDVGGEIGVAAVRLDQRPVDVVAVVGGAEQRLLAILPILGRLALGRLQPALVDHALLAQPVERQVDVAALPVQRPLGKEHVVVDVELGEIGADQLHHRGQHPLLDDRAAHSASGLSQQRAAELVGQRLRRPGSDSRRDRSPAGSRWSRPAPRGSAARPSGRACRSGRRRR